MFRLNFMWGFMLCSCVSFAQDKLIFSVDVVRHGDRTPVIASPGMEKIWPQGLGQLTPKGMRQEYELGKALREHYVHQEHMLPEHYDVNTMRVRVSNMARTMMSAQSLLLGLYPLNTGPTLADSTKALPQGFQPIPIHTVPLEQDSLLVPNHDKALSQQWLETYVLSSQDWIKKNQNLQSNYPLWSHALGFNIESLLDVIKAGDRLTIERLYHVARPDDLQEKDVDAIIDAGEWAFLYIVSHPKLAPMVGHELADEIKNAINAAASQQHGALTYVLFVAHDSTLAAQLVLLGQTVDHIPPYASRLNYALFERDFSHYEVRVTYNQKPLFIKQCGSETCSLSDFTHLLDAPTA